MRLSMEEVQKQHENTKKLYDQGLTVAPTDVKRVLNLYDTIEALQQENERLQAQAAKRRKYCERLKMHLLNQMKPIAAIAGAHIEIYTTIIPKSAWLSKPFSL